MRKRSWTASPNSSRGIKTTKTVEMRSTEYLYIQLLFTNNGRTQQRSNSKTKKQKKNVCITLTYIVSYIYIHSYRIHELKPRNKILILTATHSRRHCSIPKTLGVTMPWKLVLCYIAPVSNASVQIWQKLTETCFCQTGLNRFKPV